jgi:CBS domain containing-hemolysin-like protein
LSSFQLLLALLLVVLNGLFVAAKFAFVKIRTAQVERLVEEGKTSAGLVREATRKLDTYLSVCQLGITVATLGLGWIGEPAFAHLIEPLLAPLGVPEGTIHIVSFAAAFGTITFLYVVFGELTPKSLAIARVEGTSLFVAPL